MTLRAEIEAAPPPGRLVLGTRGSRLALAQARWVERELSSRAPGLQIELRIIKTSGDQDPDRPLTSGEEMGIFVRQIEESLLSGEIDLGVHSLKDLPLQQPDDLILAAIPGREDAADILVLRQASSLDDLPAGSRVGTGSPRRTGQLLALRPDLRVLPIRGNVDTRLEKLARGEFDAVILAGAGLHRCGISPPSFWTFSPEQMLPAPGQGALGLEVRRSDRDLGAFLKHALDHPPSAAAVEAERSFLRVLGGGCQMPVGALGTVEAEKLTLHGVVADPSGARLVRGKIEGSWNEAVRLGEELGRQVLSTGGARILGHAS
ncbi:MAG TPA: hydroxymethylbilane synthase [Candidatus Polarisedimenticolia bacterium]|nr:hydroxymethylbilane synthase [Candidatus Polarisedimenticolia bacterium]